MAKFARSSTAVSLFALFFTVAAAFAAPKKRQRLIIRGDKPLPAELEEPDAKPKMPKQFRLLREGELPLKADGAIVLDGLTGKALYEKNADARQYPASTTKIMTALLVIEAGELDREIEIGPEEAAVGESSLNVKIGERYTRREMLYGLMLKSANDVAHALGRDNAGTMDAFALKMTKRAQELGATATSFKNPHGLHHVEHFTTARDLATIGRAAMQQPFFRQIVSTVRHSWIRPGTPPQTQVLSNHNRLLTTFEGCTGVKTGYTRPAMHTLVSAAVRGRREVIAAVMHDGKFEKWEDSKLLLTYGLDHPPEAASPQLTGN